MSSPLRNMGHSFAQWAIHGNAGLDPRPQCLVAAALLIEEWFYIMEQKKEDPNGHLFPIDKDDPRWSGDFGAWRAEQPAFAA